MSHAGSWGWKATAANKSALPQLAGQRSASGVLNLANCQGDAGKMHSRAWDGQASHEMIG